MDSLMIPLCVCVYYVMITLAAVGSFCIPALNASPLLEHGKIMSVESTANRAAQMTSMSRRPFHRLCFVLDWQVPKRLFLHFYLLGAAVHGYLLVQYQNRLGSYSTVWMLWLMEGHFARRIYETLHVMPYSKESRMHVAHYFVGITYYCMIGLSILYSDPLFAEGRYASEWTEDPVVYKAVASLVFFLASYYQYRVHQELGSMRSSPSHAGHHQFPHSALFGYIVCPHYTMEILIYTSLWCLSSQPLYSYCLMANLVWVIVNLSITANKTMRWYETKFPKEYRQSRKAVLLPGIF